MIGSFFGVRFGDVAVDGRLQIVQRPIHRHDGETDRRHRRFGRIVHRKVDGVPRVRDLKKVKMEEMKHKNVLNVCFQAEKCFKTILDAKLKKKQIKHSAFAAWHNCGIQNEC